MQELQFRDYDKRMKGVFAKAERTLSPPFGLFSTHLEI